MRLKRRERIQDSTACCPNPSVAGILFRSLLRCSQFTLQRFTSVQFSNSAAGLQTSRIGPTATWSRAHFGSSAWSQSVRLNRDSRKVLQAFPSDEEETSFGQQAVKGRPSYFVVLSSDRNLLSGAPGRSGRGPRRDLGGGQGNRPTPASRALSCHIPGSGWSIRRTGHGCQGER